MKNPGVLMKQLSQKTLHLFIVVSLILTFLPCTAGSQTFSFANHKPDLLAFLKMQPSEISKDRNPRSNFDGNKFVQVTNVEELYTAVNSSANSGASVAIAPGVYMLSATDPNGVARPKGGRLELQENMSLIGTVDDRSAVVIDAINLPSSSYDGVVPSTGAIRMGRGANSLEWLTITNSRLGGAGIIAHLSALGTAYIRIAHVTSIDNTRGIDIRNVDAVSPAYVIDSDIIDNDLVHNNIEGIRIANLSDATGGTITARLSGNRSSRNRDGMLIVDNKSSFGNISVTSSGDRFFQNADGAVILGGFSTGPGLANGNTVTFVATGSRFEDNNNASPFDHGGLIVVGGENASIPNGASDNTVNVELRSCFLAFNQIHDLAAFGGRANPISVGGPGMNNHVNLTLLGVNRRLVLEDFANSVPDVPGSGNLLTIIRWPKY